MVSHLGRLYTAKAITSSLWNLNTTPEWSPAYWTLLSTQAAALSPTPAPAPSCSASNWVQSKQYGAGSVVRYSDGKTYVAKFANPGYNPTISTYYWAPRAC